MKKILIKTALVSVLVIVLPLLFSLLLSNHSKPSDAEMLDFEIYYMAEDSEETLDFNQYLMGIIAANMPAGYHMEALKAQAVIARTYALYNVSLLRRDNPENKRFSTSELGLSYISMASMEQYWGTAEYKNYYARIENAVFATANEVLVYKDQLILPLFFYTGSGYTRNASEAWDIEVPYLVSVSSKQDVTSTDYLKITEYPIDDLISLLTKYYPELTLTKSNFFDEIKVTERDSVDYVNKISLGKLTISGELFAKVLGLSSNRFYIESYEGSVRIICNGIGHGIGLSQYGANAMAQEGYPYNEILSHYYTSIELLQMQNID